MRMLLLTLLIAIPFASLNPTGKSELNQSLISSVVEILVDSDVVCLGIPYGRKCVLTSAKCASYCKDNSWVRSYIPSTNVFEVNYIDSTYTNNPFFNQRDLGLIQLTSSLFSGSNGTVKLPNLSASSYVLTGFNDFEEVQIESPFYCLFKLGTYFSPNNQVCAAQTGYQRKPCYAPYGSPLYDNNALLGFASWCISPGNLSHEYMVFTDLRDPKNQEFMQKANNRSECL